MKRFTALLGAALAALAATPAAFAANAADCPNDGVVRFGVEPYDTSAKLVPIYQHIGDLIGEKLGCKVQVYVTTNYNAEIEAMRNGKLEIGEFGPLGYVLAHQVAKARGGRGIRHQGRQAGHLLGQPRHLSRLRHQDGGGHQRPLLRLLRSRLDLGPPVPGLRPAQGGVGSGQGRARRSMPAAIRPRSRRCTTTRSMPAS